MRYGIIRISPRLPAPEDQRRRIEAVGCDVVLEERSHAPSGQNILLPLLQRLTLGDQVIVHSLEVFEATVGDLTRTLRAFNDSGVTLRLVGGGEVETLEPVRPTPRALTLLAGYEERHPTRPTTHRRARAEPSTLTSHQLKFARDMQRRGYSMREIGLLFRLSPNEMVALLGRSAVAPAEPETRATVSPTD